MSDVDQDDDATGEQDDSGHTRDATQPSAVAPPSSLANGPETLNANNSSYPDDDSSSSKNPYAASDPLSLESCDLFRNDTSALPDLPNLWRDLSLPGYDYPQEEAKFESSIGSLGRCAALNGGMSLQWGSSLILNGYARGADVSVTSYGNCQFSVSLDTFRGDNTFGLSGFVSLSQAIPTFGFAPPSLIPAVGFINSTPPNAGLSATCTPQVTAITGFGPVGLSGSESFILPTDEILAMW